MIVSLQSPRSLSRSRFRFATLHCWLREAQPSLWFVRPRRLASPKTAASSSVSERNECRSLLAPPHAPRPNVSRGRNRFSRQGIERRYNVARSTLVLSAELQLDPVGDPTKQDRRLQLRATAVVRLAGCVASDEQLVSRRPQHVYAHESLCRHHCMDCTESNRFDWMPVIDRSAVLTRKPRTANRVRLFAPDPIGSNDVPMSTCWHSTPTGECAKFLRP